MTVSERIDAELAAISIDADSVDAALRVVVGAGAEIVREHAVGGGSINRTQRLELRDGGSMFLKTNDRSHRDLFREEARGLIALGLADGPRVPRPRAVFETDRHQHLLLEWIAPGRPGAAFWERFGVSLAHLHRSNRAPACGFPADNHIGSTPQANGWRSDWHEFFAECRLIPQVERARSRGLADRALEQGVRRLAARLPDLLPGLEDGGASILHGDLWGGNYLVSEDGEPVLIDPAVYYGHREADLAMTELFGGFRPDFYRAYDATWSLAPGYRERRDIYNLYHLLNHLNLFGGAYGSQCRAVVRAFT